MTTIHRTPRPTSRLFCAGLPVARVGHVKPAGANQDQQRVRLALPLSQAFGFPLRVSFGVKLFGDGHGDSLRSRCLPPENGTRLGQMQVSGGLAT